METNVTGVNKAIELSSGVISFTFLFKDEKVLPILIIGLVISVIIALNDQFADLSRSETIAFKITSVIKSVIIGSLIMNISFFGLLFYFPKLPVILCASVAGILTKQYREIIARLKKYISEKNL